MRISMGIQREIYINLVFERFYLDLTENGRPNPTEILSQYEYVMILTLINFYT